MAAASINSQLAGISSAQFEALPPHLKLQHIAKMPNQFLMNHARFSRRMISATGQATISFAPTGTRVVQPGIALTRPLNNWMAFRGIFLPPLPLSHHHLTLG